MGERSSSSKPCCVAVRTQSRRHRASQQCRWLNVATRRARTISWSLHSGVAWLRATAGHRSFLSSLPALIIVFCHSDSLVFCVGVAGESLYFGCRFFLSRFWSFLHPCDCFKLLQGVAGPPTHPHRGQVRL